MASQTHQLMQYIRKFDLFQGLGSEELRQVIHVCHTVSYEANERVYKAGEPGQDIFILLRGHLIVVSPKGEPLDSIKPGECVGEVEIFSGGPRIANVLATAQSGGVVIRKVDLEGLMARNAALHGKIFQNAYKILGKRLSGANSLIDERLVHELPEPPADTPDPDADTPETDADAPEATADTPEPAQDATP